MYKLLEDQPSQLNDLSSDQIICSAYNYYYGRGYKKIIVSKLFSIISFIFIILFMVFIFDCVNYKKVIAYNKSNPFLTPQNHWITFSLGWFSILCLCISSVIICIKFYGVICDAIQVRKMKNYFQNELKLSDYQLLSTKWKDIIDKMIKKETISPNITYLDVANIIMKKENYMIAMITNDQFNIPYIDYLYTNLLDWNIRFCLLDFMFTNSHGGIGNLDIKFIANHSNAIELNVKDINRRLTIMAIINIFFLPIIFIYVTLYNLFKLSEEYYSNPTSISTRSWTLISQYKIHEYNELPHLYQQRLSICSEKANDYINQFPSYTFIPIYKFISFILTALILYLLFLSLLNGELTIFGFTILGYIGFFGIMLVSLHRIIHSYQDHKTYIPSEKMQELAQCMHYIPKDWLSSAESKETLNKIKNMYGYQLLLTLLDLAMTLVTPLVMIIILPKSIPTIVKFIRENSVYTENSRYICRMTCFDDSLKEDDPSKVNQSYLNFCHQYGHALLGHSVINV